MVERRLGEDRSAFMVNIGPMTIAGYLIIAIAMFSYWLHSKGMFQDGILGTIYMLAPFIFAFGVVLLANRHIPQDPRYVLLVYALAAFVFWIFTLI